MPDLPLGMRFTTRRLSPEEIAQLEVPEPDWDDFQTADGREFRLVYGEPGESVLIVELDANGVQLSSLAFPMIAQAEQVWVDLQAMFDVQSRLASDPDWGTFPKPTRLTTQ